MEEVAARKRAQPAGSICRCLKVIQITLEAGSNELYNTSKRTKIRTKAAKNVLLDEV
jgi:hypothetical protein